MQPCREHSIPSLNSIPMNLMKPPVVQMLSGVQFIYKCPKEEQNMLSTKTSYTLSFSQPVTLSTRRSCLTMKVILKPKPKMCYIVAYQSLDVIDAFVYFKMLFSPRFHLVFWPITHLLYYSDPHSG